MSNPYMSQKLACAMLGMGQLLIMSGILNIYEGSYKNRNVYQNAVVSISVGILGAFSLTYLLNHVEIK
jgi:hypothetical protein